MQSSLLLRRVVVAILQFMLFIGVLTSTTYAQSPNSTEPIRVGVNMEMSGRLASFGQATTNGIKLLFGQVNASGGINGRPVELILIDNKSDSSESANVMNRLIQQEKVVTVIGAVTSKNTIAAYPVAEAGGVPIITPTATNPCITMEDGRLKSYAFRVCVSDPVQGNIMAKFARESLRAGTAALFVENSSTYSKEVAATFEEAFTRAGGQILNRRIYLQNDTDFHDAIRIIRDNNPDVVFVPGYYEEVGIFARQARECGLSVPILGGDGWDSPNLVQIAGESVLNNMFFCNHFVIDSNNPIAIEFVAKYRKEFGKDPDALAALGYDAALMVADVLRKTGSTDPSVICNGLAVTKNLQGVTGIISVDAHHDVVKSMTIIEMVEGRQKYRETVGLQ